MQIFCAVHIFQIGAQILNNFSNVSGRKSFRLCKKGTKFCAWVPGIPDFYEWMHLCEYLLRSRNENFYNFHLQVWHMMSTKITIKFMLMEKRLNLGLGQKIQMYVNVCMLKGFD